MFNRRCSALIVSLWLVSACGTDQSTDSPGISGDTAVVSDAGPDDAPVAKADVGLVCNVDADCSHPGSIAGCGTAVCDGGYCNNQIAAKGTICAPPGWLGDVCQETRCDDAGSCVAVAVADGAGCGDAACGEICQQGKCKSGASVDDGNPCSADQCKDGVVSHQPVNDPSVGCTDGDACTEGDGCVYGQCVGKTATCDDGVGCTIDFCDSKAGCVNLPSLPLCDDGNPCTTHACDPKAGCKAAESTPGLPCDDGNPCTMGDGCDAKGACVGGTNSCQCSADGDCKTDNKCQPLVCLAGKCEVDPTQAKKCGSDGSSACGVVACEPATGDCIIKPLNEGKACNDSDLCTTQSVCSAGACKGKALLKCDDGNVCTADACLPADGCVHSGGSGPCDDGNACTEGDSCASGSCVGEFKSCDDNDPCTKDHCNGKTGVCEYAKVPGCGSGCGSDEACDDNDPCTEDVCGDGGQCLHPPKPNCQPPKCKTDVDCDDGDKCTIDKCVLIDGGAACTHGKVINCGGGGECKDASGCDDNNACTFELCIDGKCAYQALTCSDGDNCTKDSCNPATGGCSFVAIPGCGVGCKSSMDCVSKDKCVTQYCVQQQCKAYPKTCNDYDDCTTDGCDADTGACVYKAIPGCVSSKCKSAKDCDDNKVCTNDYCQLQTGKCYNSTIPNCDPNKPKCKSSADCEDKKPCTYDYCNTYYGTCTNNPIPNCDPNKPKCKSNADCDDKKPCTTDYCHPTYGTCYNTQVYGCTTGNPCKENAQCTDKNKCTSNLCLNNSCAAKPVSCDDYNPCTNDYCQTSTGNCVHTPMAGCVATPCKQSSECDDQQNCTKDSCEYGWCKYVKMPDCK